MTTSPVSEMPPAGFSNFRKRYRSRILNPAVDRWLTAIHGTTWEKYRDGSVRQDQWIASATELKAFVQTHSRWPSQISADSAEKMLGQWLNTQRKTDSGGGLPSDRSTWLNREVPGWNPETGSEIEKLWRSHGTAVQSYRETHGKWPTTSSSDASVVFLGKWLGNQRSVFKRGIMRPERSGWLDTHVPGWNPNGSL